MNTGKSILELATEIERQQHNRLDVIYDTREIEFHAEENKLVLPQHGDFDITHVGHKQIAERTGIPGRYYDTMRREAPDLLDTNVRRWFDDRPAQRMVRTLDSGARAFLSDRYRIIDNEQILFSVLPSFKDQGMQVLSSEVTDSRMYLSAAWPKMEGDVKVGDPVQMGVIIRNSEIGMGALDIAPMVYRLICTNGMVSSDVVKDGKLRQTHLGRQMQIGESHVVFSSDTREADDRALMLKIRDTISQLSDPALFAALVAKMQDAAAAPSVKDPVKAVEVVGKRFSLAEGERNSILEHFIQDRDYSKWGMLNAVTRLGNDAPSYDRSVDLQMMGGQILNMPASAWKQVAEAA